MWKGSDDQLIFYLRGGERLENEGHCGVMIEMSKIK